MERIEKDYGFLVKENGEVYNYEGGHTDDGFVYKDYEAFKSGNGICYISEYGLEHCGETRQSIIDQVRDAFGDNYMLTDEQIEYFAGDVFGLANWAYIATYLTENFDLDDLIEFDHDYNPIGQRLFNDIQYEAVMNNMYPAEYKK